MTDRPCTLGPVVAVGLAVVAFAVLLWATLTHNHIIGFWGLSAVAASVVVTIRCFFVQQTRLLQHAYRLGWESHAQQDRLTSVR